MFEKSFSKLNALKAKQSAGGESHKQLEEDFKEMISKNYRQIEILKARLDAMKAYLQIKGYNEKEFLQQYNPLIAKQLYK